MALQFQKKATTLAYKDGKPVVYKAKQVNMPKIKSAALLAYAANAANVPVANIESCVEGLIEAIAYFVINGHRVVLPEVGGFFLGVKSKAVSLSDNLNVRQAITAVRPLFAPATDLRQQMSEATVEAVRPSNGTEQTDFTTTDTGSTGGDTGGNTGGNSGGNNSGGLPSEGGEG